MFWATMSLIPVIRICKYPAFFRNNEIDFHYAESRLRTRSWRHLAVGGGKNSVRVHRAEHTEQGVDVTRFTSIDSLRILVQNEHIRYLTHYLL